MEGREILVQTLLPIVIGTNFPARPRPQQSGDKDHASYCKQTEDEKIPHSAASRIAPSLSLIHI